MSNLKSVFLLALCLTLFLTLTSCSSSDSKGTFTLSAGFAEKSE